MEQAIDAIGLGRFHVFLLLCVSLIWAGDAMEVMILSYLGPAAACEFGFSAGQQSLLSSVVFGGMVLGAATWGLAADALGRRTTLLTSCSVVVAAGLASAAAPGYAPRLVGFGLAGAPVAFTLLMELLPARSRGTWGTLVELAWTAGTVLEACLAWWLLNGYGWRPLLLASVGPLVLLLLLAQHLPESPRYLLAQGDAAAAQAVLQRIAAMNGKKLHFAAEGQARQWRQQLLAEGRLAAALLSKPPYARTTALLLFAWAATSFAYYGLVQLVAQLHLEVTGPAAAAGDGASCTDGSLQVPSAEYLSVLLTSAAEVPAVAWAAASTNWLGRRASIATSLGLTAACLVPCMAAAGLAGSSAAPDGDAGAGWGSLAVDASAAGMFGARLFIMSAFTLLWVFTPELYPTHVRAFGLGINNACARIGGLLSPFAAINLVALGAPAAAEGVFAAACLAACAAVLVISSKHDSGQPMEEEAEEEVARARLVAWPNSWQLLHNEGLEAEAKPLPKCLATSINSSSSDGSGSGLTQARLFIDSSECSPGTARIP
ncbi:major facilitator superfamily domain-containing protein [Scenedesmus sp. NREL 46B-D3]|nr:major facilitator superfamily domain-containing protein [Scenedesmus sp. NREL 46B-D3]